MSDKLIESRPQFLSLAGLLLVFRFDFFFFPHSLSRSPDHFALHAKFTAPIWGSKWMFLFQSAQASERAFDLNRFYRTTPWPPDLEFNYKFVGLLPDNTTNPPNLALPDNLENWTGHPDRERAAWTYRHMTGLFWAFNYTLHETDVRWLYRGDDDILINFDVLPRYIREMERTHDALTEFVVRGDCINNGPLYPQGGGGVLFSRHAIERLIPMSHYSIWGFWEDCPDKRLGRLLEAIGASGRNCSSSAFLGTSLEWPDLERVRERNFTGLPPCPDLGHDDEGCPRFVAPLRQYVFFHIGAIGQYARMSVEGRMALARKLWGAPGQTALYQIGGWQKGMCWTGTPITTPFVLP